MYINVGVPGVGNRGEAGWEGKEGASPPMVMQWLLVTGGPLLVGKWGGGGDLMIIMYEHLMMLKIIMIEICHLVVCFFPLCTRCRGFD